jgi:ABC-type phosphate transport system substrate-binding protein
MSVSVIAQQAGSASGILTDHPEAVVSALGLLCTLVGWLVNSLAVRRKRILYRVQDDEPFVVTPPPEEGGVRVEFKQADGTLVADPSQVLLRIKNAGSLDISERDLVKPIKFTFPGRTVIGFKFSEAEPESLGELLTSEEAETHFTGSTLTLPKVPMNRADRFNLRVLLSGTEERVDASAFIMGGKLIRDYQRRFSASTIVFGAATGTLAVALVASLLLAWLVPPAVPGMRCAAGQLQITGSTAFKPVAEKLADAYQKVCRGVHVTVDARGSNEGVNDLSADGKDPTVSASRITMSDGPSGGGDSALKGHAVGVAVFAVVVNHSVGINVHSLRIEDLQAIYRGEKVNWAQVGGPDLPISLISRGAGSGTREVFEKKVLRDGERLPLSSNFCDRRDRDAGAPVLRCEVKDTPTLLEKVNQIPGAIGYAEARTASDLTRFANLNVIQLAGVPADLARVKQGSYPFWDDEYLYTYGSPDNGSPAWAFVDFMNTETAKNILRDEGYGP